MLHWTITDDEKELLIKRPNSNAEDANKEYLAEPEHTLKIAGISGETKQKI